LGSDPNLLAEECFLDLAGWKNAAGTPEPNVTQASQNTYSERDAIATRYNADDANGGERRLRESRFRYHAEFFDTERLKRLLSGVSEPDLVRVLDNFKNPALLCYYFFYPAHDEPLNPKGCPNVEAKEFAGYGGEWSCMALLLERDDPNDPAKNQFKPTFIGFTGRPVAPATLVTLFPQVADGDSDDAQRMFMKVAPFSSVLHKAGEHPILFVAKDRHSLYFDWGQETIRYPDHRLPVHCGKFDQGSLAPPPEKDWNKEEWVVWAKFIVGTYFFGGGALWAMLEAGMYPGAGVTVTGLYEPPVDDVREPAGKGLTVRPAGLNVPGAGLVEDWRSQQGEVVDGWRYDFLVDRQRQAWWPNDVGDGGFRGRWGPRVEHDHLGRRAGMRFPRFWRMFFLALAKGKADGTF
ncbi:MAG TPA: hypothetical protein VKA90_09470, partial [Beijerinckiaceae bacterium]|nr:hypothetical protein [Beijerinckiaceae bacterium]